MRQHLIKIGNEQAIILEESILKQLGINSDTPLDVTTDGECIIIQPIQDADRQSQLKETLRKTNTRYSRALKRLAE